jgi:hypothetical protein
LSWEGFYKGKIKMKEYTAHIKDISIKLIGLDGSEMFLECKKLLNSKTCSQLIDNIVTLENVYTAEKNRQAKIIEVEKDRKDPKSETLTTSISSKAQELLIKQIEMVYDNVDTKWLAEQIDPITLREIVQDLARELTDTVKK